MHKFNECANRHVSSKYECDEVVHMSIEFFLNTEDNKIISMYENDSISGCIKYICKTIRTQATSTRSRYYYKTRRENLENLVDLKSYVDDAGNLIKPLENLAVTSEDNTTASLLTELDVILDEDISFYLSKLFRMNKIEGLSMTEIAEKTQIGRNEVFNSITTAMKQIKLAAFIREKKSIKANDYGIMTQYDYNEKYRLNTIPHDFIPKQLILDVLYAHDNDFCSTAERIGVPYGRLNKYINLHNIKL